MTDQITLIPLDRIDAEALPRDRAATDPTALGELIDSIARHGLRQPVELFATDTGYALISGHRRLQAFRHLARTRPADFAAIPAFLRAPASLAAALTAMVEENDIRADISPWEQGRIIVTAWEAEHFDTLDAAVDGLYPSAVRQRRARLRDMARVVTELDGHLAEPERLNQRQMLRLAAACRGGFSDVLRHALAESHATSPARQWRLLESVLAEADAEARDPAPQDPRPGRPRRLLGVRPGLRIRRELAPEGWLLRFTGPEATGALVEEIMDEVERLWGPNG